MFLCAQTRYQWKEWARNWKEYFEDGMTRPKG